MCFTDNAVQLEEKRGLMMSYQLRMLTMGTHKYVKTHTCLRTPTALPLHRRVH